jgi:hypothetical protein
MASEKVHQSDLGSDFIDLEELSTNDSKAQKRLVGIAMSFTVERLKKMVAESFENPHSWRDITAVFDGNELDDRKLIRKNARDTEF